MVFYNVIYCYIVQKTNKIVNVDNLDHGVHDVAFEGKVLNWLWSFRELNPHAFIWMTTCSKNGCMSKLKILELRLSHIKGFKKGTCQLFLHKNLSPLCIPFQHFNISWLLFFHSNFFKEFKFRSLQSKIYNVTIVVIVIIITKGGENNHER